MKSKSIICIMLVMFFIMGSLTSVVTSKQNDGIKIKDTSYKVLKIEGSGQLTFAYYNITITLENTGSQTSTPLTVVILEDDATKNYPGTKTRVPNPSLDEVIRIDPGETADFIFGKDTDWMVQGTGKKLLTISVHPNNNESTTLCTTTMEICASCDNSNNQKTPGFETVIVLISFFVLVVIYKKRKMI